MRARRVVARLGAAAAAVVLGLGMAAGPVSAHAVLISTNPVDGSTLQNAPRELVLTFDEAVTVDSTVVRMLDESGRSLEVGDAVASDGSGEEEAESIAVPLPELPDGRYLIRWQSITSDDFHPVDGSLTFGVGEGIGVTAVGGSNERPVGSPLETATRGLVLGGYLLAVGGLALLLFTRPVLASRPVAQRLVMRAAMVGVVAALLGLALLEALLALGTGAAPPSSFLLYWGASVVGLVAVGVLASAIEHRGRVRAPAAVLAFAAALLAAWGLGHLGHGAGSAGSALSTLHVVATGAWAGGIALLVPVTMLASRDGEAAWARALLRRFARIAVPALALSIASGALLARGLVPTWGGLTETAYGRGLALKLALVLVAVAIGAITAWTVRSRRRDAGMTVRLVAEACAVVGVVLLAAALSGGQPPDDAVWRSDQDPSATSGLRTQPVDDLMVTLSVTPGTPGPNFATVQVLDTRRPSPGAVTRVTLDPGDGALEAEPAGNGTDWVVPTTLEDPGSYTVVVRVQRQGWDDTVVSFPWVIAATSTAPQGGAPIGALWSLLALLAIAVAAGIGVAAWRRSAPRPQPVEDDERERVLS